MDHETVMDMRAGVARGLVEASDDTGTVQTVDVRTHDGILRTGIEVWQPFGHAARAPTSGAKVLVFGVGGDPADMVAMPMAHPGVRFGGLAEGDSVLHDDQGNRVAVREGGTIEVIAAAMVVARVGSTTVTLTPAGVVVTGDTTIEANATITGNATIDGQLSVGGGSGGVATVQGDLQVNGSVGVSGNLSVGGTISGNWAGR